MRWAILSIRRVCARLRRRGELDPLQLSKAHVDLVVASADLCIEAALGLLTRRCDHDDRDASWVTLR